MTAHGNDLIVNTCVQEMSANRRRASPVDSLLSHISRKRDRKMGWDGMNPDVRIYFEDTSCLYMYMYYSVRKYNRHGSR